MRQAILTSASAGDDVIVKPRQPFTAGIDPVPMPSILIEIIITVHYCYCFVITRNIVYS
jgi:hypothetical protein